VEDINSSMILNFALVLSALTSVSQPITITLCGFRILNGSQVIVLYLGN